MKSRLNTEISFSPNKWKKGKVSGSYFKIRAELYRFDRQWNVYEAEESGGTMVARVILLSL